LADTPTHKHRLPSTINDSRMKFSRVAYCIMVLNNTKYVRINIHQTGREQLDISPDSAIKDLTLRVGCTYI